MIGALFGAASSARPFYNRGVSAPPETIVRTALESFTDNNVAGISQAISPHQWTIGANDTLIVGVVYDNNFNVDDFNVLFGGIPINPILGGSFPNALGYFTGLFYRPWTGASVTDFVTLDFSTSSGMPLVAGAFLTKVSGLISASLDKDAFAIGSGTAQSSGNTAATAQAHEYLCGCIGTQGVPGDTFGAPAGGFSAGQNDGNGVIVSHTCQIKELYQIVHAAGPYAAGVTGATSRQWGATIATFKGA